MRDGQKGIYSPRPRLTYKARRYYDCENCHLSNSALRLAIADAHSFRGSSCSSLDEFSGCGDDTDRRKDEDEDMDDDDGMWDDDGEVYDWTMMDSTDGKKPNRIQRDTQIHTPTDIA